MEGSIESSRLMIGLSAEAGAQEAAQISPPVSVAVSVAVSSPVSRSVHNRAMIRLRSTHSDRLTSVSSRTTRHRTTPSRVPTAGVETPDEAWVLLPEAPNPRPMGEL
jgi:hypothetical protein